MDVATARRRAGGDIMLNTKSPLTGQPFLTKTPAAFEDVTTFREHYTALPLASCRRKPIEPLPPASVIHKNSCYLKMQGSLTQNTYKPPAVHKNEDLEVDLEGAGERRTNEPDTSSKRMFATNFQLNADRRLDAHCTTTQEGFPPIVPELLSNAYKLSHYKDVDSGPLGQRVFDPSAKSEYSSVFGEARCEKDGNKASEIKLPPLKMNETLRNTLTGTPSRGSGLASMQEGGELLTTHRDTFRGEALSSAINPSELARRQRQRITCIPQGDRSKVAVLESNHQTSYHPPSQSTLSGLSASVGVRPPTTRQINQSSIKLRDHTKAPAHYFTTTTTDTFQQPGKTERASPLIRFSRNASFFPRGDLDPGRVKERLNHVTTKSAHPQPPAGSFPAHVDSSNFHTQSSVHLGWSQDWLHPSGTMAASYQPLSQLPHRAKAPSTDNLPLHYYPGHLMNSTTADSYRSVEKEHTLNKINPQALNNLKCSHWSLPSMGDSTYITTHRECFTAPKLCHNRMDR